MTTKKANIPSKPKLSVSAKIDRMIDRADATVKAYASVNIGGEFVIKDIAVVDGQKGMFTRMPFRSYKGANGDSPKNEPQRTPPKDKNRGGNPIRTSPPKKETAPDLTEAEIIKDLTETEVPSNEPF